MLSLLALKILADLAIMLPACFDLRIHCNPSVAIGVVAQQKTSSLVTCHEYGYDGLNCCRGFYIVRFQQRAGY